MRNVVTFAWNYVFDHDVSPLKNINDVNVRHMVFQLLGWMWAISFSVALGSYTVMAISLLGHIVLIGAVAITVATYTTAKVRPQTFAASSGRRQDGEHV